ncbi:MAG: hypothetical protein WDW38_007289 [Sanguina aurantia]
MEATVFVRWALLRIGAQLAPEVVEFTDPRPPVPANELMFIIRINGSAAVQRNLQLYGANIGHDNVRGAIAMELEGLGASLLETFVMG